jgi:hypothetical protein
VTEFIDAAADKTAKADEVTSGVLGVVALLSYLRPSISS